MKRKWISTIIAVLVSIAAFAQNNADSAIALFDDMKIPLVEKRYVANTNFQDNWFLSLYAGGTSNFGSDASHAGYFRLMGPMFAIALGKEITPVSTFRLLINYARNTGVTDDQFGIGTDGIDYSWMTHNRFKWNSYGLSMEYMVNFTNLFLGFRENRKFHLQGLIGIGGMVSRNYTGSKFAEAQKIDNSHSAQLVNADKYQNRQHSLVSLRAGLAGTFMVARNWNINIEVAGNFLDNSFDSNPTTSNVWDGRMDYLLGVSYRFNNKGGLAPGFYYPRHDMTEYIHRLYAIDDTRDRTRRRRQELEEQTDTIDVEAQVMYTLIAFDEGSAEIDRLQQTNIYTTAYAWTRSPNSNIYITNSTGVDDNLFRKRAQAIRNIMLERYEMPASKIWIVASEKDINPIGDYIELIVND